MVDEAALVQLHAGCVQAHLVGVGLDADGHEHLVGGEGLHGVALQVLHRDRDAVGADLHLLGAGAGEDLDALLGEGLVHFGGHLCIFQGQDLVQHLDDGDFGAVGCVDIAELHADGAGADDDEFLGHFLEHHGIAVLDDALAVDLGAGQAAGAGAGGDDEVGGGDCLCFGVGDELGGADLEGVGVGKDGVTLDHVDLVLLHQETHALGLAAHDVAAALDGGAEVDPQVVEGEAVVGGFVERLQHLGIVDQRLGGDAAPVEADAAQALALDDGRLQPQLRRPNRGHIAARPAADHDYIILIAVLCHELFLCSFASAFCRKLSGSLLPIL